MTTPPPASNRKAAFRELEHTADLAVELSAEDLPSLFAVAGEALYALIADPETIEPLEQARVSATGVAPDELLHAWLRELLARFNVGRLVGKRCEIVALSNDRVEGVVFGETLDLGRHTFYTEIKGVTYHDFKVWSEGDLWRAIVVFDV
ncbi:MAG TPA: archease [Candidatus Eisenbacteria bacterium]|nr:archease [Candidatus Eisenbacteria bacterium]